MVFFFGGGGRTNILLGLFGSNHHQDLHFIATECMSSCEELHVPLEGVKKGRKLTTNNN